MMGGIWGGRRKREKEKTEDLRGEEKPMRRPLLLLKRNKRGTKNPAHWGKEHEAEKKKPKRKGRHAKAVTMRGRYSRQQKRGKGKSLLGMSRKVDKNEKLKRRATTTIDGEKTGKSDKKVGEGGRLQTRRTSSRKIRMSRREGLSIVKEGGCLKKRQARVTIPVAPRYQKKIKGKQKFP